MALKPRTIHVNIGSVSIESASVRDASRLRRALEAAIQGKLGEVSLADLHTQSRSIPVASVPYPARGAGGATEQVAASVAGRVAKAVTK
jgi:hypothetical protein